MIISTQEKGNQQPAVAHRMSKYLSLSATFIYHPLQTITALPQLIIANSTANEEVYPTEWPILDLSRALPRGSLPWLWDRLNVRLRGRPSGWPVVLAALRRHNVGLIHAHIGTQGVWALPYQQELGCKLITSFYGGDLTRLIRKPAWQDTYRRLFAAGDLFLVEGSTMRRLMIEAGCPPDKVRLHRIGINLEVLSYAPRRLDASEQEVRLLLVARFVEKKGIPYALEALSRLVERYPQVRLRILGDGELRPQIENQIAALGLQKYVHLLGYQPMSRYWQELRQAHMLLVPSVTAAHGDTEGGAPTVLLEAQATGLPIVSTYHADIPEVVIERESALLVPEKDASALAAAIAGLLDQPERWPTMGQIGREHVARHHDVRTLTRQLETTYLDLLEAG